MHLCTEARGRVILRSSFAGSCIDAPSEPRGWPESAATPEAGGLLWCWIDMQDLGSSWIHQRCYRGVMVEEKGKQAEERQDEPRHWRPWRPPSRRMGWGWRVLWAVGMVVAVLIATGLLIDLRPEIGEGLLGLLEGMPHPLLTLVALGFSLTAIIVLLAIRMGWRVLWAVGMVVALLTTALLIVHLHPEIWKG